jgi:ribonuclease P protein component
VVNKPLQSLRKKTDFDRLFEKGRMQKLSHYLVVRSLATELGQVRYGISIPSALAPAVLRNRIKRWIREYFKQRLINSDPLAPPTSVDLHFSFRRIAGKVYHLDKKADRPKDLKVMKGKAKSLERSFYKTLSAKELWTCLDRMDLGSRKSR